LRSRAANSVSTRSDSDGIITAVLIRSLPRLVGVLTRSAPNLGHLQTRNLYAAKISRWCADIVSGIAKTFPKAVGKRPASGRYLNQTIGISATNLSVRAHHEQE